MQCKTWFFVFMLLRIDFVSGALVHTSIDVVLREGFVMCVLLLLMTRRFFFMALYKQFVKGLYVAKGL